MSDNQMEDRGDQTPAADKGEALAVPQYVYPLRSGIIGGLLGGAVMALVAAIAAPVIGHSIWFPLNVAAAGFLPNLQGATMGTLEQFMLDAFIAGLIIHIIVSIVIGLAFTLLLPTLPGPPLVWSVIIGAIMWATAMFLVLPIVNPVMEEYVEPVSFIIGNVAYTVTLGWWITRSEKVRVGN